MASQNSLSLLESLPQDLLGEILSRVSASSLEDIRPCLYVSKAICEATHDERVFKNLNLRRQAMNPLITYERYTKLMAVCIRSGNPEARFIEGVKLYFVHNNSPMGLLHLQKSAEGKYDKGIYLYGILMLLLGNKVEGKRYLRSLGWKTSKVRTDRCWREIKITLRYFMVDLKPEYTNTLDNNHPPERCHPNDLQTRCGKCFYYKQMRKFIAFIM